MNELPGKKKKIGVYLVEDEYSQIKKYSQELNMPITTLCTVLIKLGLQVISVSRDPKMIEYFDKLDLSDGK